MQEMGEARRRRAKGNSPVLDYDNILHDALPYTRVGGQS